jgi:hypothetical protein
MAKPDDDDLLQVDQQPWVRRELSMSVRVIGLGATMAAIAGAIYLALHWL